MLQLRSFQNEPAALIGDDFVNVKYRDLQRSSLRKEDALHVLPSNLQLPPTPSCSARYNPQQPLDASWTHPVEITAIAS